MTTRVTELWDRPRVRTGFGLLAAVVLAVGVVAFVRSRQTSPPVATVPSHPFAKSGVPKKYGKPIKLPAEVRQEAKQFISDAVLRENPAATWSMVAPKVRGGLTQAQWATGTIPVPQFPRSAFGGAAFKVVHSRQRDILLDVYLATKNPQVSHSIETLIELQPVNGRWLIVYVAPKGGSVPVPAAQ